MKLSDATDLEPLLPMEFLTELAKDTLAELKTYEDLATVQDDSALLSAVQSHIDHAVAEQIPALRQFSADLLADLHRYITKGNTTVSDHFVFQVYSQLLTTYDNIYCIKTLKEALIIRGRLQFIHDCLKKEAL